MAWLVTVIVTCTLALAGCVTVPTSGHVQAVNVTQGAAGGGQDYLQPIPVPPGSGWGPQQIVSGFLAANASFANDHAVARQYLTSSASQSWRPGWAVTVFSQNPSLVTAKRGSPHSGRTPATSVVQVSGQVLGTVSDSGQYAISAQGRAPANEKFVVVKQGSDWRISGLPSVVLLNEADFQHVYQPRNVYFFDPAMQVLIPDPLYVPQEATPADLVAQLLQVLLAAPSGWLLDAAQTAFPAGTRLLNLTLDGATVIVNLGGAVAGATSGTLRQMSAQLLWTLARSTAVEPSIQSVELEVNGNPVTLPGSGSPAQQIGSYASYVPSAPAHASFYYADGQGQVRSLSGAAQASSPQGAPVPGAAGTGQIPLTTVAVSPDGRYVAGLGPGGVLYTGSLARKAHPDPPGRRPFHDAELGHPRRPVGDRQRSQRARRAGLADTRPERRGRPGIHHAAVRGARHRPEGGAGRRALRDDRHRQRRLPAHARGDRAFRPAGQHRHCRVHQRAGRPLHRFDVVRRGSRDRVEPIPG